MIPINSLIGRVGILSSNPLQTDVLIDDPRTARFASVSDVRDKDTHEL